MPIKNLPCVAISLLLATGCEQEPPAEDEPELSTAESEVATCVGQGEVAEVVNAIAANCGGVAGCSGTNTATHNDLVLSGNDYCGCYTWLWERRHVAPFSNVQIIYHNAAENQCGSHHHIHVANPGGGPCNNGMGGMLHMDIDTSSVNTYPDGSKYCWDDDATIDNKYDANCGNVTDQREPGVCVNPGGGGGGGMNEGTPGGRHLERGVWCDTDSVYGPGWDCTRAQDVPITEESKWASSEVKMKHWLVYDLGAQRTVNGYIVRHAGAAGELPHFNTAAFKIQSAPSTAGPWTIESLVYNTAQENVTTRTYNTPKQLRYVRLFILDPGIDKIARIPGFEVWGP